MVADPSGELPVNPYSLLAAVNDASEVAHTSWLIFLAVVAYFCIAVAGIEHKDLLLNSAVQLPMLQVTIELTRFFLFAPIVLVFLHFGLLVQHVMLAKKTLEFHAALRPLETTRRRSHPLRLELHSYFFTQVLAGVERSRLLGMFLHGMTWLSLVALPVFVILFIQVTFLPYHDVLITWSHRIALVVDVLLLLFIGVFLGRRESRFFAATGRLARAQPMTFMTTGLLFVSVMLFSFFVATIPDEGLDRLTRSLPAFSVERTVNAAGDPTTRPVFGMTALLFEGDAAEGGAFASPFQRNLIVTDEDLVSNKDDVQGEVSINLRNRDLRLAILDRTDLHRADLTGSRLEGASLVGADLRNARLTCSDPDLVQSNPEKREEVCAHLAGVDFHGALLDGADLSYALVDGAKFDKASLVGANLSFASLSGAELAGADLRRANLSGSADLMGANLLGASLEGAILRGAKLHGADLGGATLQGADLHFAQALGASFSEAVLDGADLGSAKLQGARFDGASLKAADLSGSTVWFTRPPDFERIADADVEGLKIRPIEEGDVTAIEAAIAGIRTDKARQRVVAAVADIRELGASSAWEGGDEFRAWESILVRSPMGDPATYPARLTADLAALSCQTQFSEGAVAAGVVRRALRGKFKGQLPALDRALRRRTCLGGAALPQDLRLGLAAKAEAEAAAAGMAPTGDGVAGEAGATAGEQPAVATGEGATDTAPQ
ncbi:MAG: pentapeptide repeat-containing protein [Hyphomicrobiaceae bacterium]